jgi:hypothetical protein
MLFTDPIALIRQAFNDHRNHHTNYVGFSDSIAGSFVVGLKSIDHNIRYIMIRNHYKEYLANNLLSQLELNIVSLLDSASKRVILANSINSNCFCLTKYFLYPEFFDRAAQNVYQSPFTYDGEYKRVTDLLNSYANLNTYNIQIPNNVL